MLLDGENFCIYQIIFRNDMWKNATLCDNEIECNWNRYATLPLNIQESHWLQPLKNPFHASSCRSKLSLQSLNLPFGLSSFPFNVSQIDWKRIPNDFIHFWIKRFSVKYTYMKRQFYYYISFHRLVCFLFYIFLLNLWTWKVIFLT